jgi:hypothetical protein
MVIGTDGFGLVAYYDSANGDLRVAHCTDAACTSVTTATVDSTGDVGRKAAMVMASPGPVISYEDTTNGAIKLALCADPACTTSSHVTVAPLLAGDNTAVALASDGRPLVAFVDSSGTVPTVDRLKAAHCDDAGCGAITISDLVGATADHVGIVVGGDGRGMIHYTRASLTGPTPGVLLHCADVACTAGSSVDTGLFSRDAERQPLLGPGINYPSMRVGADGFIRVAVAYTYLEGPSIKLLRCLDATCFINNTIGTIPARYAPPWLALAPGDLPPVVRTPDQLATELDVVQCNDKSCTSFQPATCFASVGRRPSLGLTAGSASLVAYEVDGSVRVVQPPATCGPILTVQGASVVEGSGPQPALLVFKVGLAHPAATPSLVSYSTVDGSAQGGVDYEPTSGTLTFVPGQPLEQLVEVPVYGDSTDEPQERLELVLSAPVNAEVDGGRALGLIVDDDDPTTRVSLRGDCAVVEGDAGPRPCPIEAFLSEPSAQQVTVEYLTSPQTATSGVDYLAASGTLTFAPGTLSQTVTVAVLGDVAVEPGETFFLNLANPLNALAGDFESIVTIVDDDAPSLANLEVAHGAALTADLIPDPGPSPDEDLYHVAQAPFASYEVVLDAVSGDATPGLRLERLAADGSTVLQSATTVGTGTALQMRYLNLLSAPVDNQYVRVRGATCGTGCGTDDVYRLRLYETTAVIPRFNNVGNQATVLILQNTTDQPVQAYASFWAADGAFLKMVPITIPPRWVYTRNTVLFPELNQASGSVTIAHDAPYGALAGKAVALDSTTGLAFDSPMVYRPR